ncbi:hypothetical protein Vadar_005140 [Vaccinium darrowii]|uniref:Uncharacterized protein n=1 Tax=Vaccinium darrowii TaxID=229202 RepID=A0ACB7Y550_9ERIC|nr:hypothetical protein Vadar_005140 [Vaccinium darrowii]
MESSWSTIAMDHDMACPVCKGRCIRGTSWTDRNPGRRYVKCPNIVCDDFLWIDPPIFARAKQIIAGSSSLEKITLQDDQLDMGVLILSKGTTPPP